MEKTKTLKEPNDCNDRRNKNKIKVIKEILIGVSIGFILAITSYIAENILDLKAKTNLLTYQHQETTKKLDIVSEKVDCLSLSLTRLDEKSNYLQKTLELHMKKELSANKDAESFYARR
jgi:hypothetical protein